MIFKTIIITIALNVIGKAVSNTFWCGWIFALIGVGIYGILQSKHKQHDTTK